jgi:uroporphyrinogen decarboxylase
MNSQFKNAIASQPQKTPPIWFMRQAGRYHKHYQGLRAKHSFEQLCRQPELAAQVAMGPIEDFDYDVAILFSDILFPLDGLGMQLSYSDAGPKLEKSLASGYTIAAGDVDTFVQKALSELKFQAQALKITREMLPASKSLIGFVGGLWTLFVYACEGGHSGSMTFPKNHFFQDQNFLKALTAVVHDNIKLQIEAGAEVVMIFDTAAGEVSHQFFKEHLAPTLMKWSHEFPGRLGYYSKGTQPSFFTPDFINSPWAGRGVDHRCDLPSLLKEKNAAKKSGFLQGNFDQALLFQETSRFEKSLQSYLKPYLELSEADRAGWVCGLGHGVLPKTPEIHVHKFIETVRKAFS